MYQGIILFCQICQVNAEAGFYEPSKIFRTLGKKTLKLHDISWCILFLGG